MILNNQTRTPPLPPHPYHAISPHYKAVHARFEKWLTGLNAFDPDTTREVLNIDLPLASCLIFPQAAENLLFYIAKYYTLFTIVDDIVENDITQKYLFDDLMSYLRNGYATDNVFSIQHQKVREEIKLTAQQTAIIITGYENYIESVCALQQARENPATLTLEKYSRHRKWDVEVAQDFALYDLITGTTLTTAAWSGPLINELMDAYCRLIWLENDYISLERDEKDKNPINIIILLCLQEDLSKEHAITRCYQLIIDSRQQLNNICEKAANAYPQSIDFINAVKHGAYGYGEFSRRSGRYKVAPVHS